MVRSAAKNFESVAIVCNPARYPALLEELQQKGGELSRETRCLLAVEAYGHTARYDGAIHGYLAEKLVPEGERPRPFPQELTKTWERAGDPYGTATPIWATAQSAARTTALSHPAIVPGDRAGRSCPAWPDRGVQPADAPAGDGRIPLRVVAAAVVEKGRMLGAVEEVAVSRHVIPLLRGAGRLSG